VVDSNKKINTKDKRVKQYLEFVQKRLERIKKDVCELGLVRRSDIQNQLGFLEQDPFDDHMAEMLGDRIEEQREKIMKGENPFIEPCPDQISGFEVAWAHLTEGGVLWGVNLRRGENKK